MDGAGEVVAGGVESQGRVIINARTETTTRTVPATIAVTATGRIGRGPFAGPVVSPDADLVVGAGVVSAVGRDELVRAASESA